MFAGWCRYWVLAAGFWCSVASVAADVKRLHLRCCVARCQLVAALHFPVQFVLRRIWLDLLGTSRCLASHASRYRRRLMVPIAGRFLPGDLCDYRCHCLESGKTVQTHRDGCAIAAAVPMGATV